MKRLTISLVALLALSIITPALADLGISSVDARRAGLEVQWSSQVNVPPDGKIVDIYLKVNPNRSRTLFGISYGSKHEIISEFGTTLTGLPLGQNPAIAGMDLKLKRQIELLIRKGEKPRAISDLAGVDQETVGDVLKEMQDRVVAAEEAANNRQEILQLMLKAENRDVEVKLEKMVLPRSTLFVTTTAGFVQAMDADTGLTHWTTYVGNRRFPTIGVGASDDRVAVINGSTVHCLDAENGELVWSKRCRGQVGGSPVVTDTFVFVPLINGRLEAFPSGNGIGAESIVAVGKARSRPTLTEDNVCWTTDKGYFTVASNREVRAPSFRLRADAAIVASGSGKDGRLFVGSTDGFCYGVDEERGVLLWDYSTGQRIKQTPIPIGQYVYIITSEQQMFKLFAESGIPAPNWSKPISGVKRYVGASKDRVFVQNTLGQIIALSQANGTELGRISSTSTDLVLPNYQTDRIYVGNGFGSVQCLREVNSEQPYFHTGESEKAALAVNNVPGPAEGGGPSDPFAGEPDNKDPFGAGEQPQPEKNTADPFGAFGGETPAPAPNTSDPFGSFGGGASSSPSPAPGGNSDPFGGGGSPSPAPNAPAGGKSDPFGF